MPNKTGRLIRTNSFILPVYYFSNNQRFSQKFNSIQKPNLLLIQNRSPLRRRRRSRLLHSVIGTFSLLTRRCTLEPQYTSPLVSTVAGQPALLLLDSLSEIYNKYNLKKFRYSAYIKQKLDKNDICN